MHILFLSDNFPPEVNAPASRTFEHCREWVRVGHQVSVITCAPNFPKGELFAGYKNKLWQTEEIEGIRIIRVWSYITANDGFVRRILDYVSFMLSAIIGAIFIRKVDLVIGTSPQFFTVCAAYIAARLKRIPWVFELRDIWPESIRAVGAMKGSKALDILEKIELFLYRKATLIISVTNAFKSDLIRRGIDGDKVHVVTNGVDISRFSPRKKDAELVRKYHLEGKFVAGYIGTHGMAHALDTVLNAADHVAGAHEGNDYCFIMLGDGAKKSALVNRANKQGTNNIIFIDTVPKEQVVRYWSLLDVSIVHLKKTKLFTKVIPTKIFESMAMGVPVLHGVEGESAAIIAAENTGILFKPQDENSLIAALFEIKNDKPHFLRLKKNAPIAAKKFDRQILAQQMLSILSDNIFQPKHPAPDTDGIA